MKYRDLHFDSLIVISEQVNGNYGYQRTVTTQTDYDDRQLAIIEDELDGQQLIDDSVVDKSKATHFAVQIVTNNPALDSTTNNPIAPSSTEQRSTLTLEANSGDSADTSADYRIIADGVSPDTTKEYNGLFLALTTVVQVEPTSTGTGTTATR